MQVMIKETPDGYVHINVDALYQGLYQMGWSCVKKV